MHFFNICVKNLQIHQLFIQFIMYGSSYMFRHYIAIPRQQSETTTHHTTRHNTPNPQYSID
jgi:hypothetical protein